MSKKCLFLAVLGALCFAGCSDDSSGKEDKAPECGNIKVESGEACDDGNTESGDGCTADCSAVEDGYLCPQLGGACEKREEENPDKPKCGNGKVENLEKCDDGNREDGDGCSSDCSAIEAGYDCPAEGGACTEHVTAKCGDGHVNDSELCDDGNTDDEDGCSADCMTIEDGYQCPTEGGTCTPTGCGNGTVERDTEECDHDGLPEDYGQGECTATCRLAHYCGDANQSPGA